MAVRYRYLCAPVRYATNKNSAFSIRQCASRMGAIDHAERVAGIAERTTTSAEASFVSKRRSCHGRRRENLSPNAFGIAEARDVIFAPTCNHWALVLHSAPMRQKLCAPRSRPHPAVSAATRDPVWRRSMRAVRACPCAEAHRHASTRAVILATLTPRSGLSRHAAGANPTVARPMCRRVGEPCRSAHGTPSGGS